MKEAGIEDPSEYPDDDTGPMIAVCDWFNMTRHNFSLVYAKYPEGLNDSEYRWILIVDQAYGRDGETALKSREPPSRLPFDSELVDKFLEPDIGMWRSVTHTS